MSGYAELACCSNYSFLRGASHPRDLVTRALTLGHRGLGIADRNSVAGVVRAYSALEDLREEGRLAPQKVREGSGPGEFQWLDTNGDLDAEVLDEAAVAARAQDFKLVVGARLVFSDETPDIIAYPKTRAGWGTLCRLLTRGNRRAKKGDCTLALADLLEETNDLALIVVPGARIAAIAPVVRQLNVAAPNAVRIAAHMRRRGDDRRRLAGLRAIAAAEGVRLIAVNDVLYADPADRDLQDVMTCIREGVAIMEAGTLLESNAERHLKSARDMARLFKDAPEALDEIDVLLNEIAFSLGDLRYEYPDEPVPEGWTPQAWLETLTWRCAHERYPHGIPPKVAALLRAELELIAQLDYAPYFLTIYDIVLYARSRDILCQGRGSAANSAVCFALGITAVNPADHDLLFARFISAERREPPDIDVDFEHERREEVIQYIYAKYGRHRAGIAATVISYRPRSAIRDVGKALGLTDDVTAKLASTQWGSWGSDIKDAHIVQAGLDPGNPTIRQAVGFALRLLSFPRHLSQHVGGFVLTRGRLDEIAPIGNAAMADRTFIEWDKDDIAALGLMKVDVLALGMLTCIRKALDLLREHEGIDYGLADVPDEDPAVYDMLCKGDSLGVFQVESRAQMNMLPRLKPRQFYDLVIQVAIVRPGPIQGDMVHPYLRRRNGLEAVSFPAPAPEHGSPDELRQVLGRTLGVPLFQEQAMKLAMTAALFSDVEANRLRRAMATFRNVGTIGTFESLMVERMTARGYDRDFAQRCFEQIKGFGSYGFPESHAASFAKLVYISSWIKCRHPAAFACALLNAQPMGFYAPAQIVRDARDHGVRVHPIDINHSHWDNTLERDADGALALRLGFRQMEGLREVQAHDLVAARGAGYLSVEDLARRAALNGSAMRALADADAFGSLGCDRREALWAVHRLPDVDPAPLFMAAAAQELGEEASAPLPLMSLGEHVAADYQTTRLSLKAHPMAILRPIFEAERVASAAQVCALKDGRRVRTAGVVLVRQRPGAGNAIFITLEDETGVVNLILWARVFETFRREVMGARLLMAEGRVQKSPEGVVHVMVERIIDRTAELARLSEDHVADVEISPADEFVHPQAPRARHPRDVRLLPKSRDFH